MVTCPSCSRCEIAHLHPDCVLIRLCIAQADAGIRLACRCRVLQNAGLEQPRQLTGSAAGVVGGNSPVHTIAPRQSAGREAAWRAAEGRQPKPKLSPLDPLPARNRTDGPRAQDYKDANHKPEMAIAITEFEAVCSFVPMSELSEVCGCAPGLMFPEHRRFSAAKRICSPCSHP